MIKTMKIVLLAEDDTLIRELYVHEFKKVGMDIETRTNGVEALQAIQGKQYDMVLLDLMMPQMNGIDVLKNIREHAPTAALPVILLTNLAQDPILQEGVRLGITAYFIKSRYKPADLAAEIKAILDSPERLHTFIKSA